MCVHACLLTCACTCVPCHVAACMCAYRHVCACVSHPHVMYSCGYVHVSAFSAQLLCVHWGSGTGPAAGSCHPPGQPTHRPTHLASLPIDSPPTHRATHLASLPTGSPPTHRATHLASLPTGSPLPIEPPTWPANPQSLVAADPLQSAHEASCAHLQGNGAGVRCTHGMAWPHPSPALAHAAMARPHSPFALTLAGMAWPHPLLLPSPVAASCHGCP